MADQKVSKLYFFCHCEPHHWYSRDGATEAISSKKQGIA
jgi:hypothetical protein